MRVAETVGVAGDAVEIALFTARIFGGIGRMGERFRGKM